MGYYTYINMTVTDPEGNETTGYHDAPWPKEIAAWIEEEMEKNENTYYILGRIASDSVKCYGTNEELQAVYEMSAAFPNYLFQLDGDGDDSDDVWRRYFKAGKCQHAGPHFVYDDFNPERLLDMDEDAPPEWDNA